MVKLYSENFDVALYRFKERVAAAVNSKRDVAPVRAFSVYNPIDYWVETKKTSI
jgi:hypothetical protein